MGSRIALGIIIAFFLAAAVSPALAATNESLNVGLTVEAPLAPPAVPPLEQALLGSGQGLAGFLTAIQNPLVDFLLFFGIIIGTLSIFYAVVYVMKNALDTTGTVPRKHRKTGNPSSHRTRMRYEEEKK